MKKGFIKGDTALVANKLNQREIQVKQMVFQIWPTQMWSPTRACVVDEFPVFDMLYLHQYFVTGAYSYFKVVKDILRYLACIAGVL